MNTNNAPWLCVCVAQASRATVWLEGSFSWRGTRSCTPCCETPICPTEYVINFTKSKALPCILLPQHRYVLVLRNTHLSNQVRPHSLRRILTLDPNLLFPNIITYLRLGVSFFFCSLLFHLVFGWAVSCGMLFAVLTFSDADG